MLSIITRAGYGQPWYFNEIYNPNNTWASGMSIIGTDEGYFGCAISSDSVSDYYYNTCTFLLNPVGEIVSWKNFGMIGSDYYPGDEGALIRDNNGFGLFGSVVDFINDSIYGLFYKFDQIGDTVFTHSFISDSYNHFIGRTCTTTIDGGYALMGDVSEESNYSNAILIKTDSNGNEEWRNYFGSEIDDWAKSVIQTSDHGFALGCWSRIPGQNLTADPTIFKTDSLGNFDWSINLGGPYKDDKAMVCNTQDSCIMVLTAYADSMWTPEHGYTRINLIKLDLEGNVIWNKKYGSSKPVNYISNIVALSNGDFITSGYSKYSSYLNRAGWLFRFNSNGDSIWYRDYYYYPEDPSYGINNLFDVSLTADNGFVATGMAETLLPPNNENKMWVLKVDSVGCEIENCWVGIEEEEDHGGMEAWGHGGLFLWPNPAKTIVNCQLSTVDFQYCSSSGIYLSLVIYDIFGREVQKIKVPDGQEEFQVNVAGYSKGVYIAILRNGFDIVESRKFVVAR
jgi:hypothetical protein